MTKKFSELVIELSDVWLKWMIKNKLSHDTDIPNKIRSEYARNCEKLINRRNEIINKIDEYFKD